VLNIAMLVDVPAFHLTGEPRALLNTADSGRSV